MLLLLLLTDLIVLTVFVKNSATMTISTMRMRMMTATYYKQTARQIEVENINKTGKK